MPQNFGGPLSAPQLKIIQEGITLMVFAGFSIVILKEKPRPNEYIAMGLIFAAVVVAMWGRGAPLEELGDSVATIQDEVPSHDGINQ